MQGTFQKERMVPVRPGTLVSVMIGMSSNLRLLWAIKIGLLSQQSLLTPLWLLWTCLFCTVWLLHLDVCVPKSWNFTVKILLMNATKNSKIFLMELIMRWIPTAKIHTCTLSCALYNDNDLHLAARAWADCSRPVSWWVSWPKRLSDQSVSTH